MMSINFFKRFIILPVLLCFTTLKGQEVIEIKDKKVVKLGETFAIAEGTVVKMGPGAFIDVKGSLLIKGTKSRPVKFVNIDSTRPALGIQITGIKDEGTLVLNEVYFNGLIQPLRFDPFWYRKVVTLQGIHISNSTSSEPIIYVASPFIDLRNGKKINFSFTDFSIENNASGIILESVGSNGVNYNFNNLYFADNTVVGGDNSLGVLHLDFAESLNKDLVEMGNVAFERNHSGDLAIGLSVSGSMKQTLKIGGFFGDSPEDAIFDQKKDPRIPLVEVMKTGTISEYGKEGNIKYIIHTYGDLRMVTTAGLNVKELLNANNQLIEISRSIIGDTQVYSYLQGLPKFAILSNGKKVNLPTFKLSDSQNVILTKIDTADYNEYLNSRKKSSLTNENQSHEIKLGFNWKLPTFAKKDEVVKKLGEWEIGMWGGGSFYGGGDIKHKRFMDFKTAPSFVKNTWFIKGIPLISTIDLSVGLYAQYNLNTRFSLKGSIYRSTVSIHDLFATGLFGGTLPLMAYNTDYDLFKVAANSYGVHFTTDMWIGEVEGLWHLRSYQIKDGKKSKLIPTLGLSVGIFHFTPYRYAYTGQRKLESREDYVDRMKSNHKYNLRDLGSEGQNFIAGAEPYSTIAFNIGSSFSLTYLFKRFTIKGEIKGVYTSTDYLDDFGPGFWYGGDVEALKANHKIDQFSAAADLNKIVGYNANIAPNSPRSTDGLNDWYFQTHLGISYRLFKK